MEVQEKTDGSSEALGGDTVADPQPSPELEHDEDATVEIDDEASKTASCRSPQEIMKTLEAATSSTVDHMSCFSDAAGHLQECVLDASTKGNHYINSCLRLNEEMKGMGTLATQLSSPVGDGCGWQQIVVEGDTVILAQTLWD
ncbi:hypothetical protein BUALT_Bualt05G0054100 [Buddleja alternifolia]|uniref:BLOC-1-related complex subunit 6 C-terminal helix domain-containing protein n=1 Tax=Buddleja alternifolia TaxID=168488 RepID=A0AAV6XGW2_9LAMI|nr:hypothetical protein BUALT_Bualt05G0054100 [Buddleja alternifolia]